MHTHTQRALDIFIVATKGDTYVFNVKRTNQTPREISLFFHKKASQALSERDFKASFCDRLCCIRTHICAVFCMRYPCLLLFERVTAFMYARVMRRANNSQVPISQPTLWRLFGILLSVTNCRGRVGSEEI
jgi:hypothetical protein